MKLLGLLAASLLSTTALAAKPASADRFSTYHARSSGPLELDDTSYEQLTAAPRDYTAVVVLTALEARFGCQICKEFQPEWDILARSYNKGDKQGDGRILFGSLDFVNGRNTFQKLMLQTAPIILLFHPTTGPNAKPNDQPLRYEFSSPQSAEQIYSWIQRHAPERDYPPLVRPINYTRIVVTITTLLGLITFGTILAPYVLPIIQNRNLWAAMSLIAVLLFTSGHMFNHIRKVPYIAGDGKGGITYFAGGFQNQLGLETQIVAAMYGLLAFATIALALRVPRIVDPKYQQLMVITWGLVSLGMYSFLLSVFRIKNGGYPFFLPPF